MRKTRTLVLGVAISLAVAACGGSNEGSVGNADTDEGRAGVKAAQAVVDKFKALPTFKAPGSEFDAKKIGAGKKLLILPHSSQIPYNVAFGEAVEVAAKKVGMQPEIWQTTGKPDEHARGIQYAIAQKFDAITLVAGMEQEQIIPQIQAAEKAGIPVISSTYEAYGLPNPGYLRASVPLDYAKAADLMANYTIAKSNGTANILVVESSSSKPSQAMTPAIAKAVKEKCPACKTKNLDFQVNNWDKIQAGIVSALTTDPSIDYILPVYDGMADFAIAALRVKGMLGKVGIVTFNGTPGPMALIKSGEVTMDVGQNITWTGNATVDAVLRVLGKVGPSSGIIEENIPLRIFDASNVNEAGTPPNLVDGYGTASDEYLKLWGLS